MSARACNLVQHDRGGYRGVKRFGRGRHGDRHDRIAFLARETRNSLAFGTDDEHDRGRCEVHIPRLEFTIGIEANDKDALFLERIDRAVEVRHLGDLHARRGARSNLVDARGHADASTLGNDHTVGRDCVGR